MAAYRLVYGFGHLRADCRGPGSAPEPYARFEYGTITTATFDICLTAHISRYHTSCFGGFPSINVCGFLVQLFFTGRDFSCRPTSSVKTPKRSTKSVIKFVKNVFVTSGDFPADDAGRIMTFLFHITTWLGSGVLRCWTCDHQETG